MSLGILYHKHHKYFMATLLFIFGLGLMKLSIYIDTSGLSAVIIGAGTIIIVAIKLIGEDKKDNNK